MGSILFSEIDVGRWWNKCETFVSSKKSVGVIVVIMGSIYPMILKLVKNAGDQSTNEYPFMIGIAICLKNMLMLFYYSIRFIKFHYSMQFKQMNLKIKRKMKKLHRFNKTRRKNKQRYSKLSDNDDMNLNTMNDVQNNQNGDRDDIDKATSNIDDEDTDDSSRLLDPYNSSNNNIRDEIGENRESHEIKANGSHKGKSSSLLGDSDDINSIEMSKKASKNFIGRNTKNRRRSGSGYNNENDPCTKVTTRVKNHNNMSLSIDTTTPDVNRTQISAQHDISHESNESDTGNEMESAHKGMVFSFVFFLYCFFIIVCIANFHLSMFGLMYL